MLYFHNLPREEWKIGVRLTGNRENLLAFLGLIIYNAGYSLLNPLEPELSNELGINEVFCHEIAHQWFGDLVTTDWWSNIVLNEGFAAFFETEAAIKGFPSQSGPFLDSAHILSTYISYSTARSHPIVSNGTHFDG